MNVLDNLHRYYNKNVKISYISNGSFISVTGLFFGTDTYCVLIISGDGDVLNIPKLLLREIKVI